jgi:hypothetical protein
MKEKGCARCGILLTDSNRDYRNVYCKTCLKIQKAEHYQRHKEKIKQRVKKYNKENPDIGRNRELKKNFDTTLQEYNIMLKKQNGVCAICGSKLPLGKYNTNFLVDHDHLTKKVRGLLCGRCNFGLGQFQDNSTLLRKAAEYLDQNTSQPTDEEIKSRKNLLT